MTELVSINPVNGMEIGRLPVATADQIREKVGVLRKGAALWKKTPLEERLAVVRKMAGLSRNDSQAISELMTREQGKPVKESRPEVENSAERLEYFCDTAARVLQPVTDDLPNGSRSITRFEPVGVIAAIKPWNFPFGIPLWTIGPALIAGNAILFKPSERTPLIGQLIHDLFRDAGLPDGVMETAHGGDEVGRAVVASDVDMVSFVGSQAAGRSILKASADHLRRVVLELGGKDPMIVCADASFDEAVDGAVAGTFRNCGQVCCSSERIFVEKPLYEKFVSAVRDRVKRLKVDDGLKPGTDVGPMNRPEEIERVERHIRDAVEKGAEVVTGGGRIEGQFFEPTVLRGVTDEMIVAREETFGPVMSLFCVDSVEEAVAKANALEFGLTASVWSADLDKAQKIAADVQAGTIGINQMVGSVVQAPWGGVKKSGIGRMLGPEAVREFTNTVNYRLPAPS